MVKDIMAKISEFDFIKIIDELESFDMSKLVKAGDERIFPKTEMFWQIDKETGKYISKLAKGIVLELGTGSGFSTLWLAKNGAKVYTVERDEFKFNFAKKYIEKSGLDIIQINGEIEEVLFSWDKKIDVLFIDCNKKGYLKYFKLVKKWLNSGSIVIADNVINRSEYLKEYVDYMNDNFKSEIVEIGDGLMISYFK